VHDLPLTPEKILAAIGAATREAATNASGAALAPTDRR
jgi:hypothetical protein